MGSKFTLLIGHRGVGKTAYLKAYLKRHPHLRGYDLDAEIARREATSLAEILARGERAFRNLEVQTLQTLIDELKGVPALIAAGAGFEGPVPERAHVLWLRRSTDALGRVFLNRPRLNQSVPPFEEYMERFSVREKRYHAWAHEELWIPEGGLDEMLSAPKAHLPFELTLLPENFRDWGAFWGRRRAWNLRRVELRDDLLTPAQMQLVQRDVPAHQILYTCRLKKPAAEYRNFDWPLEMGPPPPGASIVSLHEPAFKGEPLAAAIVRLEQNSGAKPLKQNSGALLKLAFPVSTFLELQLGHEWWKQDPLHRAFLPRSSSGRWRWYRSLFGPQMPLHFFREGEGSSLDQPFYAQTLLQKPLETEFAAVLGHPVEHSRSPLEHLGHRLPFVAIDVQEHEFSEALAVLQALGLQQAAVTAPLKLLAGDLTGQGAINTLAHDGRIWHGCNTDVLALEQIARELPQALLPWVWGRGAMAESIKKVWPQARLISARAGTEELAHPDLLIWATGRGRPFQWPGSYVKPKLVLDLNYSDDSPGLEWAAMRGLPYQSGLKMFKLQAEAQRQFWKAQDL